MLNRIYQGRVSHVDFLDPSFQPEADWAEAVWRHHSLFQDAVNYYLVCLAGMGSDKGSSMGKLRTQMYAAWEPFRRGSVTLFL